MGLAVAHSVFADELPVELTLTLEPARAVVPGERIRVLITVATPRWFTGGTRLRLPEVPGLVLLQNQEFASNATERRGQASWTLQRWSIDAFATRAGSFILPPIEVAASVSLAPGSDRTLTLYTQPQTFSVTIPAALTELDSTWVASPQVTLEQWIDRQDTVAVGAAIKRTVSLQAEGVMAMMLPALDGVSVAGLQTYPEPALLTNKATRGALKATRVENTTYIATQPGKVHIPSSTVYWWNTTSAKLELLKTPETHITISGRQSSPSSHIPFTWLQAALTALALMVLAGGYWVWQSPVTPWIQARLRRWARGLTRKRRALFANPLPDRLNPGGSDGAPLAGRQPQRDSLFP